MNRPFNYNASPAQIASALTGQTVRYLAQKSQVKQDGVRIFKIKEVEDVLVGHKSGKRFVNCLCYDVDDAGTEKFRNLSLEGIDLVI